MADKQPPHRDSVSFPKIHLEDDPDMGSDEFASAPGTPGASTTPNPTDTLFDPAQRRAQQPHQSRIEAERLIRRHLHSNSPPSSRQQQQQQQQQTLVVHHDDIEAATGESTRRGSLDSTITLPEEDPFGDRPGTPVHGGVLGHLMRLYHEDFDHDDGDILASRGDDDDITLRGSRPSSRVGGRKGKRGGQKGSGGSGSNTETEGDHELKPIGFANPRWYNASRSSLNTEAAAEKEMGAADSASLASPAVTVGDHLGGEEGGEARSPAAAGTGTGSPASSRPPTIKTTEKKGKIRRGLSRIKRTVREQKRLRKLEGELKITQHIAETLQRQKYILRLCRGLMITGAPMHRLEEYLTTTAHVLSVSCSFVYLPGCMVVSFNDSATHTSDVQLVRAPTALDLGKLQNLHIVYKEVLHDVIGVDEGTDRIEEILKKPPRRNKWYRVLLYGGASAAIGPLFDARVHDLPFCFILGSVVAYMALVINPKSEAFANCFEVLAALIVSFFARAIGSLRKDNKEIFCFSGIAQGAIAPLILPGTIMLWGCLELQSKKLVAGAVRMFYAVIYSVLLWFGISLGTALYGAVDKNATIATKCTDTNLVEYRFLWAPLYAFCVGLVNQSAWIQTPAIVVISAISYTVTFFTNRRFPLTPQIANTLASFTVGVLGNLYSRIMHQAAFTVMVPAILLQLQSGIASAGSLTSGLKVAQTIVEGKNVDQANMAEFFVDGGMAELAYGLVTVSVAITFGLFLAAVVVYPFGKRRSGFFSF